MLGTPVTTLRRELEGRILAIDSEIAHNRSRISTIENERKGHEKQLEMLTELRAGYQALVEQGDHIPVSIADR